MKILVVIPARLASSRFPEKPLAKINNVPMIQRTYLQCSKVFSSEEIIVATDSKKILDFCNSNNIRVTLTSENCLTGSDRVAEVSNKINADIYINVQGDEPIFDPSDLEELKKYSEMNPTKILCGYTKINDEESYFSNSVPKVVFKENGDLMYMSRSPIPGNKDGSFNLAYRQVCAYSFPKKVLEDFSFSAKKTRFECEEDIEILRFLEKGYEVRMVKMGSQSIPVDFPEDVKKVEYWLDKNGFE